MSDNGLVPKQSICKVSVKVVPVSTKSKNPPIVKQPQPVKLTEGDDIGFLVCSLSAKDPDNDTLWYDIVGEYILFHSIIFSPTDNAFRFCSLR